MKDTQETVAELRRNLREAEVEEALTKVVATLHGVSPKEVDHIVCLGPTITTLVTLEGTPVRALLDTGTPVTIVSLGFALGAMANSEPWPNPYRLGGGSKKSAAAPDTHTADLWRGRD